MYPRPSTSLSGLLFILALIGLTGLCPVAASQTTSVMQITPHRVRVTRLPSSSPPTYPPDTAFLPLLLNVEEFLESWTEYDPLTCQDISPGMYTATSPPMFGTLTYEIQDAPGACTGTIWPFNVANYTWTSTTSSAPQDFFSLQWTTPDGLYTVNSDWLAELLPQSETSRFYRWSTGEHATVGDWLQTLEPTTINYAGVRVQEYDPSGAREVCTGGSGPNSQCQPDTCWYRDSTYAPYFRVTGGPKGGWLVKQGNLWGLDGVGRGTLSVDLYQTTKALPCSTSFPQQMQIQFATGDPTWYDYGVVNTLGYVVNQTSVVSTRAGKSKSLTWPPASGTETGP